jgi:hypothetical protein
MVPWLKYGLGSLISVAEPILAAVKETKNLIIPYKIVLSREYYKLPRKSPPRYPEVNDIKRSEFVTITAEYDGYLSK